MARTVKFPFGQITYFDSEFLVEINRISFASLDRLTKLGEARIKEFISQPGTGRRYRLRGRPYIASAPGLPPTVKDGLLRASIVSGVTRIARGRLRGVVGTNVRYASFLETGTAKMAPRPMWRRVVKELRDDISRIFKEEGG